ncbi:hypothetical protein V5799_022287 [Amblyomma americanum]|uniref:Transmembrane protein n=1 Tax=Amblyomma americanum TaxID=6943 RepID=A0AAQ4FMZ9_AMBAM
MGDASPPLTAGGTGTGGSSQTQELEEHAAEDSNIKRRLMVGALCVLFLAAIFSYLILDALAGRIRPDPGHGQHEEETPPPYPGGYGNNRNERRTTPPPPTEEPDTVASNDITVPSSSESLL